MIYKISNNILEVNINNRGAELFSIFRNDYNHEYLWQGDKEVWASRAPILFPSVGSFYDGYMVNGLKYTIPKHGFVRPVEFEVNQIDQTRVQMSLHSSEYTKHYYPFDFEHIIEYYVENNTLMVKHTIKNTSLETMWFSLGLHTGFRIATQANEEIEDSYIEFEYPETLISDKKLTPEGFFINHQRKYSNGIFNLSKDSFNEDGIFFENLNSKTVKLKSMKTDRCIQMSWDKKMTVLGIWAKPQSKFVCIEPCFSKSIY